MSVALALVPLFLLIVLGQVLRRLDFPGAAFWPPAERLMYYLLFPALLISKLTDAHYPEALLQEALLLIPLVMLLASLILYGLQRLLLFKPSGFTSVFQGGIRFNSYLGLAAVNGLLGADALAIAAVCMAIMIPIVNVLCVLVFHHQNPDKAPGWNTVLKTLAQNPLIWGCALGIAGNVADIRYPEAIAAVLNYLSAMALPLGLLCVGAAIDLRAFGQHKQALVCACLFKLIAMPILVAGLGALFALSPTMVSVMVIIGSLPTATASYILARQLGGDAPLYGRHHQHTDPSGYAEYAPYDSLAAGSSGEDLKRSRSL